MARSTIDPLVYLENRIRNPIEGRDIESIDISKIAGTHGTDVESVHRLARDGYFSGSKYTTRLRNTFHVTPNLELTEWDKVRRAESAISLIDRGYNKHPMSISEQYAESLEETDESSYIANGSLPDYTGGVIIGFNKIILQLVRDLDGDHLREELEAVLCESPPIEAIEAIWPIDKLANKAIAETFASLRSSVG